MVCETIACPHPRFLESFGLTQDDLEDWRVFYLFKNGALNEKQHKLTESEKIGILNAFKDMSSGEIAANKQSEHHNHG